MRHEIIAGQCRIGDHLEPSVRIVFQDLQYGRGAVEAFLAVAALVFGEEEVRRYDPETLRLRICQRIAENIADGIGVGAHVLEVLGHHVLVGEIAEFMGELDLGILESGHGKFIHARIGGLYGRHILQVGQILLGLVAFALVAAGGSGAGGAQVFVAFIEKKQGVVEGRGFADTDARAGLGRADHQLHVLIGARIVRAVLGDTVVIDRNIAAAGHHKGVLRHQAIDHDQLVVRTPVHLHEHLRERIDDDDLRARFAVGRVACGITQKATVFRTGLQGFQFAVTGVDGAAGIDGQTHIHATLDRVAECTNHGVADAVALEDVIGHIDRVFRVLDQPEFRCQRLHRILVLRADGLGPGCVDRGLQGFADLDRVEGNGFRRVPGPVIVMAHRQISAERLRDLLGS